MEGASSSTSLSSVGSVHRKPPPPSLGSGVLKSLPCAVRILEMGSPALLPHLPPLSLFSHQCSAIWLSPLTLPDHAPSQRQGPATVLSSHSDHSGMRLTNSPLFLMLFVQRPAPSPRLSLLSLWLTLLHLFQRFFFPCLSHRLGLPQALFLVWLSGRFSKNIMAFRLSIG